MHVRDLYRYFVYKRAFEDIPTIKNIMISQLDPGYTDTFSNHSVFILLHFQIDPLWIAYSNDYVSMIVSSLPCKQKVKPQ